MDWAPAGLLRLARAAYGLEVETLIRRVLEGDQPVHPDCPRGPDESIVYADSAWIAPDALRAIARDLAHVTADGLLTALPTDPHDRRRFLDTSDTADDPAAYYREYATGLLEFDSGAAARGLALVVWCD